MSGGGNILGGIGGAGVGSAMFGPAGAVAGGILGSGGAGGLKDIFGNKIKVPGATAMPAWTMGANGKLRDDLTLGKDMPQSFNQSQGVLDKLVAGASAAGPTASAQYLQQQNDRNTQNALGSADALAKGNMASMTNQLAMRGGLDSGARERLAKSSGFETMMNKQKIMNDASGNNLDILAKDESQKLSTLQALPASLLAQAGMSQANKQFDISNTLNTFGQKYNQDMTAWGANQAAREQAQLANKKSGLLGLGIGGIL